MKTHLSTTLLKSFIAILTITVFFLPNISQGQETTNTSNSLTRRVFFNPAGLTPAPMNVNDLPEDPQHPMYGLNLYIPAWDEDYETNLDWYGSGDVDGNDTINMADYNSTITSSDPFGDNDGSYRFDTDMDGDAGDADDKAIIMNYINGDITHINRWELESSAEKQSHLENAFAIDPTSEIVSGPSGWICGHYMTQTYANFNGVYDINNSVFANDNGTNVQYDLTHNGIFRIPLRNVNTQTSTNIGHNINNVYLGSPENQDATEFEDRIYVEPQTDEVLEPGDFTLNDYAEDSWYGYYESPVWGWKYGVRNLVNYDLDATPIVGTNIHPDLVPSWTPFDQVTYPSNQNYEFPGDTSVAVNGEPGNLYTGTVYSYSDVSTQTNDSTCTDVTYTVTRTWDGVAGAYDSSNTSEATGDQIIDVEDTTVPEAVFPADSTMEFYVGISTDTTEMGVPTDISDNSGLELIVSFTDVSTQTSDGSCSDVHFTITRTWAIEDICENMNSHDQIINVEDNTPPTYEVGENGPENVEDNSGLEVIVSTEIISTQGNDPESCDYYYYTETTIHIMTDVCGNESSYEGESVDFENEAPYIISVPVPNSDTIFVAVGGDIHPDNTGWAEWADPEGGPITTEYSDELIEEDNIHRLWYRTQIGADPCEVSPDTAYHYIYEFKPTGVEQESITSGLSVFPNPTNGDFNIRFNKTGQVKIGIYNLYGQLIKETVFENILQSTTIKMRIPGEPEGIYFLKIQGVDGSSETVKVLKRSLK